MGARVLRVVPRLCEYVGTSDAHQERAIRSEQKSGGGDAVIQTLGNENIAHIGQHIPVEAASSQGDRQGGFSLVLDRLGVRQVDDAVVVRVEGDVHEPGTVPRGEHFRHTRDVPLQELAVADHPQRAAALGHQDVAVVPKSHTPRV